VKKLYKSAKGVSLATVVKIWHELNTQVFEGKLHEPLFRITRARGYFAKFVSLESSPHKWAIYISGFAHRGLTDGSLRDSIAHEMIHQWQQENGFNENEHDKSFTQWIPVIQEKTGIVLTNSWSEDSE
jgi:hypothetical protein